MKEIPLTQGKVALVDDEDYEYLNQFKWYAVKSRLTYYAYRNIRVRSGYGGQKQIRMHSEVISIPSVMQYDHIDGNGLNNTRNNLRSVTPRGNAQNLHIPKSSKYPGVSWFDRDKCWRAKINIGNWQKHLGYFKTEEEAYERYCLAVRRAESLMIEPNYEVGFIESRKASGLVQSV